MRDKKEYGPGIVMGVVRTGESDANHQFVEKVQAFNVLTRRGNEVVEDVGAVHARAWVEEQIEKLWEKHKVGTHDNDGPVEGPNGQHTIPATPCPGKNKWSSIMSTDHGGAFACQVMECGVKAARVGVYYHFDAAEVRFAYRRPSGIWDHKVEKFATGQTFTDDRDLQAREWAEKNFDKWIEEVR
jgi:hypothetical protein